MFHLPDAGDDEDERLCDGPPKHSLVGALAGHAEALLTILADAQTHGDGRVGVWSKGSKCRAKRRASPSGSSAPSGSAPPGPAAVAPAVAAPSAYL